jgi:hypothetical protein
MGYWAACTILNEVGSLIRLQFNSIWTGTGTTRIAPFHDATCIVKDGAKSKDVAIPEYVSILRLP